MIDLFLRGGPIMWPILLLSIITLGVVIERLLFLAHERLQQRPKDIEQVLSLAEHQHFDQATEVGQRSSDPTARAPQTTPGNCPLGHTLFHRTRHR